jgi:hypothetical protein
MIDYSENDEAEHDVRDLADAKPRQPSSARSLLVSQNLSRKSSYSSIEEFLKSPEDAVPLESIKRAAVGMSIPETKTRHIFVEASDMGVIYHETPDTEPAPSLANSPKYSIGLSIPRIKSRNDSADSSLCDYSIGGYSTGGYSTGGLSGRSGHKSVYSAASASTSLSAIHSYAGSARVRTKKARRLRYTKELEESCRRGKAYCSFCGKYFSVAQELEDHELSHCLPQTFPCTFCDERFNTQSDWENHETSYHCQPQLTWFCMLHARVELEKCIFCGLPLSSTKHYVQHHNLRDCGLPLDSRTFSTRYDILQHLVKVHGMLEEEVNLKDGALDYWSIKVNSIRDWGLWHCGYCGLVGTDWDHRLKHIRKHWAAGGPRFTHAHPWTFEKPNLQYRDATQFLPFIRSQKVPRYYWPGDLSFNRSDLFEAALKHRARKQEGKHK